MSISGVFFPKCTFLFAELFTIDGLDDDFGSYHSSSEDEDDVPNGEISCAVTHPTWDAESHSLSLCVSVLSVSPFFLKPFLSYFHVYQLWLVWLKWFNTESSPKRYWQGHRSQEMGEEGDYTQRCTVTTRMTPALRWAVTRAILMLH